jgi:hypothetical protein
MTPPRGGSVAIVLFAAATMAVVIAVGFWGFSYDDSFITYRYADQWSRGQGLTFNYGEHVLGTTAPGYALLLGALCRATRHVGIGVPEWGTLVSLASLFSLTLLLALAVKKTPAVIAIGTPVLFAAVSLTSQWNLEMIGTETLAVAAVASWAAWALLRSGRPLVAGALVAAAMIVRLDAGLAAAAIGLTAWVREKRFPTRFAAAGLLPVALWLTGLYSRFGHIVPNTLAAKRAGLEVDGPGYTAQEWAWLGRTLPMGGAIVLLILGAAGMAMALRRAARETSVLAALALWIILHELTYRVIGVPFAPWYHEALLLAIIAAAAWGAAVIAAAGTGRLFGVGVRAPSGVVLAALLLAPVLVPSVRYTARHWHHAPDPRYGVYRKIGEYLRRQTTPGTSVAAVEIGVLGFFGDRPILDLMGLITPEALAARHARRLGEFVDARAPTYVVCPPNFRDNELRFLDEPPIAGHYVAAAAFSDPDFTPGPVVLEKRRR